MRIIFLSHMFPNCIEPYSVPFMIERARALSKLTNMDIVSPVSYFPFLKNDLPSYSEKFADLDIMHPRYLAMPSLLRSYRWIPYYLSIRKQFRKLARFDIIHSEWIYPDAFAAVLFGRPRGIKTTAVVHGNEAIEYFGPFRMRKIYKKVFRLLDRIIVVSKDLKNKLVNEYDVDEKKIKIILNGIEPSKFTYQETQDAKKKLHIKTDKLIGVCIARLSEEKNIDIMIKAAEKLGNECPDIYIVGDGPLKKQIQHLINCSNIKEKIKLVGAVAHDQVNLWLNAGDFFCLPSSREGCPVVIHEALACGVPVISTKVGAIPDLIKSHNYGFLCEPDNTAALSDIIKKGMTKVWDRKAIADYGIQFTWDKVAQETVSIFQELLK